MSALASESMSGPSRPVGQGKATLRYVVRRLRRARVRAALGGRAAIPDDAVLGPRGRWLSQGTVRLGNRVFIGADFFLEADLTVGDDVLISSRVAVIADDHPFDDSPEPITAHPRREGSRVRIEGDNLIGHGTIIIAPATIGRGTIVGAGSLVIGDLPADSVCVGRPARVIRKRRGQDCDVYFLRSGA